MKKHHFPNAIAETIEERLCFKRSSDSTKSGQGKKLKQRNQESVTSNKEKKLITTFLPRKRKEKHKPEPKKKNIKTSYCISLSQPAHSSNPTLSLRQSLQKWQPPVKVQHFTSEVITHIAVNDNTDSHKTGLNNLEENDILLSQKSTEESSCTAVCGSSVRGNTNMRLLELHSTEINGKDKSSGSYIYEQEKENTVNDMKCDLNKTVVDDDDTSHYTEKSFSQQSTQENVCLINNCLVSKQENAMNSKIYDTDAQVTNATSTVQEKSVNKVIDTEDEENNTMNNIRNYSDTKEILKQSDINQSTPHENMSLTQHFTQENIQTMYSPVTVKSEMCDTDEQSTNSIGKENSINVLSVKYTEKEQDFPNDVKNGFEKRTQNHSSENLIVEKSKYHEIDVDDGMESTHSISCESPSHSFSNKCNVIEKFCENIEKIPNSTEPALQQKYISLLKSNEKEVRQYKDSSTTVTGNKSPLPLDMTLEVNSQVSKPNTDDQNVAQKNVKQSGVKRYKAITKANIDETESHKPNEDEPDQINHYPTTNIGNSMCGTENRLVTLCHSSISKIVDNSQVNIAYITNHEYVLQNLSQQNRRYTDVSSENMSPTFNQTTSAPEKIDIQSRKYNVKQNVTGSDDSNTENAIHSTVNITTQSVADSKRICKTYSLSTKICPTIDSSAMECKKQRKEIPKNNSVACQFPLKENDNLKVFLDEINENLRTSSMIATKAPYSYNVEKTVKDCLTTKNIVAPTSNLLDEDDIGLTSSQLLRIEDECRNIPGRAEAWNYSTSTPAGRCSEARIPDIASLTPVDWVKNVMEKRQKLKNVILEISRLNDMIMLMRKEVLAPKQTAQSISTGRRHGQPSGLRVS
ncbi:putative uncharacterized protein DDB_G0282499 isoform X2 [Periplaneta americana]